jgi:hypothetical protein
MLSQVQEVDIFHVSPPELPFYNAYLYPSDIKKLATSFHDANNLLLQKLCGGSHLPGQPDTSVELCWFPYTATSAPEVTLNFGNGTDDGEQQYSMLLKHIELIHVPKTPMSPHETINVPVEAPVSTMPSADAKYLPSCINDWPISCTLQNIHEPSYESSSLAHACSQDLCWGSQPENGILSSEISIFLDATSAPTTCMDRPTPLASNYVTPHCNPLATNSNNIGCIDGETSLESLAFELDSLLDVRNGETWIDETIIELESTFDYVNDKTGLDELTFELDEMLDFVVFEHDPCDVEDDLAAVIHDIDSHCINIPSIVTASEVPSMQRGEVCAITHQYAYVEKGKITYSCRQMEAHKQVVYDKCSKVGGNQCIEPSDDHCIPYSICQGLPYLTIRPYTDQEWKTLPYVILLADKKQDSPILDYPQGNIREWLKHMEDLLMLTPVPLHDEHCGFRYTHINTPVVMIDPMLEKADLTDLLSLSQPYNQEIRSRKVNFEQHAPIFAWLPVDTIKKTFGATTQYYMIPTGTHLKKRYKSLFPACNAQWREKPVAIDTVYADTPAIDSGVTAAQFFVGTKPLVCDMFLIKTGKQFVNVPLDNIKRWGAMTKLISDRAQVEISYKVQDILRNLMGSDWQSEAHQQHQNLVGKHYQDAKRLANTLLNCSGAPPSLRYLALLHACPIINHTVNAPKVTWETNMQYVNVFLDQIQDTYLIQSIVGLAGRTFKALEKGIDTQHIQIGWDLSMWDEVQARCGQWTKPLVLFPDPAPNLAHGDGHQLAVHGEINRIMLCQDKSGYFEVPPPAPNIHLKPSDRHSLFVSWRIACCGIGIATRHKKTQDKAWSGPFVPWENAHFHGSHVHWRSQLETPKPMNFDYWDCQSSIHQLHYQVHPLSICFRVICTLVYGCILICWELGLSFQNPLMMGEAPMAGDMWLNPKAILPDPAPNLADESGTWLTISWGELWDLMSRTTRVLGSASSSTKYLV